MATQIDIDRMPRGGPDASCLDRLLETDRPSAVNAPGWTGRVFGNPEQFALIALEEVAEVPDPRILELGAGHGALSRALLQAHPTARVTVTDIEADAVAALAAGDLGSHPRAEVRQLDATAIDAPDGHFALAVFALSFHQLPPELAARALAAGTRVADKLLIIDLPRPPAPLQLLHLATTLPLAPFVPSLHDGVISLMRTYSPSALRALAEYAGIDVELRGGLLSPQITVATRR